jgi:ApaG protein
MYKKTTDDITVSVYPIFLDDQSSPEKSNYMWAYYIRIENNSEKIIQITNRYWKIIDSCGHVQEVNGEGVVGEKPIIDPKSMYEYASGVPLTTPSGFMEGHYVAECENGETFNVLVPAFSLDSPFDNKKYN